MIYANFDDNNVFKTKIIENYPKINQNYFFTTIVTINNNIDNKNQQLAPQSTPWGALEWQINMTIYERNLHIYIFEGTLILEATAKNVAYDNKNEFFLHIYFFFSTFVGELERR